jgi:hypothetical protein
MVQIDTRGACNMYYLSGRCNFGELCKYSHDLELSEADIAIIRLKCKRVPCEKYKFGEFLKQRIHCDMADGCDIGECPFGDECMYGHMCRFSKSKCKFLKKGGC